MRVHVTAVVPGALSLERGGRDVLVFLKNVLDFEGLLIHDQPFDAWPISDQPKARWLYVSLIGETDDPERIERHPLVVECKRLDEQSVLMGPNHLLAEEVESRAPAIPAPETMPLGLSIASHFVFSLYRAAHFLSHAPARARSLWFAHVISRGEPSRYLHAS